MHERWQSVPWDKFEQYEVSTFGRVRRVKGSRFVLLKPRPNRDAYLRVWLHPRSNYTRNKIKRPTARHMYVHRLVLLVWKGKPPFENDHACHCDHDRQNNRIDNLRWDSPFNNLAEKNHRIRMAKAYRGYGDDIPF